jgi:hypothetical protein
MPENNKQFLDEKGLQRYHQGVIAALGEKAFTEDIITYVGNVAPSSIRNGVWLDTSVDEEPIQQLSLDYDEDLVFGEDSDDEELVFGDDE